MNKDDIYKRMNATVDILTFINQQIAAQVKHEFDQRLPQEREYWRCHVVDLIAAEREQIVKAVGQMLLDGEAVASISGIVKNGLAEVIKRIDAKLAEVDHHLASVRHDEKA